MNASLADSGLRVFRKRGDLDVAAADVVLREGTRAIADRGRFSLALSGGTTPRGLFELLASEAFRDRIDWKRIHVFWADERCVPSDHEDSNYRVADELLLSRVPIPPENIHRIHGEADPASAAAAYDRELASFFGYDPFTFDLALLGMGRDGHTASLFPGDPAAGERDRYAVPVPGSGARLTRVTVTFPTINRARAVLFLVAGEEKAETVRAVIEGGEGSGLPAARVSPASGRLLWFLDKAAARLLRIAP